MIEYGLYALLLFMIAGALVALELDDLFSSVIALGAVGLTLSAAFLLLQAPDLAVVQFVVEVLILILLLQMTSPKDILRTDTRTGRAAALAVFPLLAAFAYFSYLAFQELPAFGHPLAKISQARMPDASNVLAALMVDHRGLDTLGEAVILFTAVVAVLALLRRTGRMKDKGRLPGEKEQ